MSPRMQRIAAQQAAAARKKAIKDIAIVAVVVPLGWFALTLILVGAGYAI